MAFRFKKFRVYQDAKKFVKKCSQVTRKYIKKRNLGLASQIDRALISIVLNIAEGSAGESDPDFARFLGISIKSVNEVVSGFDLAKDLNLISEDILSKIEKDAESLLKQLSSFRKKLKN
ncbi:four helix bundle protein [Candidatus Microgenomates bacterium]|nr:four helix bundle protein [Candidatus Microgenomates bacterium]